MRETTVALLLQRGPAEYDLFLRPDLHTHGHTQWFYFAVRDTHPPGRSLFQASPTDGDGALGEVWVVRLSSATLLLYSGVRECIRDLPYALNELSWLTPHLKDEILQTLELQAGKSMTLPW